MSQVGDPIKKTVVTPAESPVPAKPSESPAPVPEKEKVPA